MALSTSLFPKLFELFLRRLAKVFDVRSRLLDSLLGLLERVGGIELRGFERNLTRFDNSRRVAHEVSERERRSKRIAREQRR